MARLTKIEGIGAVYAQRLADVGIGSTEVLLEKGATPAGRREIVRLSGLTEHQVLSWVNRADLMRVEGVGAEYSDLLEASGVDTVVELALRNPEHLHEKLVAVNQGRHLVRRVPGVEEIAAWIGRAKELPRVIEY